MAPPQTTLSLSSCDVIVVGGFTGSKKKDEAEEEDEERQRVVVVGALERIGMTVGLASRGGCSNDDDHDGDDDDRRRVAAALTAAVEEEQEEGASGGHGHGGGDGVMGTQRRQKKTTNNNDDDDKRMGGGEVRALVVVGLGASGPRPCDGFLNDRVLRASVRRFALRGGVVLLHGRGGAVDEVTQEWFGEGQFILSSLPE